MFYLGFLSKLFHALQKSQLCARGLLE